jgi:hypothetical protein
MKHQIPKPKPGDPNTIDLRGATPEQFAAAVGAALSMPLPKKGPPMTTPPIEPGHIAALSMAEAINEAYEAGRASVKPPPVSSPTTAARLYEIVKDVPREIWPVGLGYSPAAFTEPVWIGSSSHEESVNFERVDFCEAAFVGAMVKYQIGRGGPIPTKYETGYMYRDSDFIYRDFPTMIEALAAACKEAK